MGKRIYRTKTHTTIKVRLQHTDPNGEISPLLAKLVTGIDKSRLVSFSAPRLGTNPKYDGQQATAVYLEIDYNILRVMFAALELVKEELIPA
jgi:hypothetical protein